MRYQSLQKYPSGPIRYLFSDRDTWQAYYMGLDNRDDDQGEFLRVSLFIIDAVVDLLQYWRIRLPLSHHSSYRH